MKFEYIEFRCSFFSTWPPFEIFMELILISRGPALHVQAVYLGEKWVLEAIFVKIGQF